jgi:hypothetical protein
MTKAFLQAPIYIRDRLSQEPKQIPENEIEVAIRSHNLEAPLMQRTCKILPGYQREVDA